jgi:hypothetical protein
MGHCVAYPTNAKAGSMRGVYTTVSGTMATVNHPAKAGGTFAVYCSVS